MARGRAAPRSATTNSASSASKPVEGPNYEGVRGEVAVFQGDRQISLLHPEKRQYWVQQSVMTEAGIDMQLTRDLFAALGEDLGSGRWSVRAQVRPLINYVWSGGLPDGPRRLHRRLDRRYRRPVAARARCRRAGAALPRPRGMNRFLVPLAAFALLVVVLAFGIKRAPAEMRHRRRR